MSKLPSFQFYPGDWLKDPALRLCSPQARALWIDMLCLMWETENRGILRTNGVVWTERDVEKTTGIDRKFLRELLQKGVCAKASRSGVFFSKRILRDELKRARLARNGQKGGKSGKQNPSKPEAKPQAKPEQIGKQNIPSSSSSSVSSSVGTELPKSVSSSPSDLFSVPPDVDRSLLSIPTKDGKTLPVTDEMLARYGKLYPTIDVVAEVLAMHSWVSAKPSRPMPVTEVQSFMAGWFKRTADRIADNAAKLKATGMAPPRRASDYLPRGRDLVAEREAAA